MKLVQFVRVDAAQRVGVINASPSGDVIVDITNPVKGLRTTLDLIDWAERHDADLAAAAREIGATDGNHYSFSDLDVAPGAGQAYLSIPIVPPEVWGCGVTYRKSAEFRDEDTQTSKGIYDYVYAAPRPEIFFKATGGRCVGPNAATVVRSDSRFTAPEPELAVVIGASGRVYGYTVADDVSAWDIERENPLYLPQSKIFRGCCALGPTLVTPDDVANPYGLTITCRLRRGDRTLFEDSAGTDRMKRRIEDLVEYLLRDNPVPSGTVILTGTGIIVSAEHALLPGDVVEIAIPEIGTLRNPVGR